MKVEILIVAGFIGLLNVALIMAVVEQTLGEASSGVTEVTVGGVNGSPGFPAPAFLSSPHPVITTANRNAETKILLIFNMRINFSPFFSDKASHLPKLLLCESGNILAVKCVDCTEQHTITKHLELWLKHTEWNMLDKG